MERPCHSNVNVKCPAKSMNAHRTEIMAMVAVAHMCDAFFVLKIISSVGLKMLISFTTIWRAIGERNKKRRKKRTT